MAWLASQTISFELGSISSLKTILPSSPSFASLAVSNRQLLKHIYIFLMKLHFSSTTTYILLAGRKSVTTRFHKVRIYYTRYVPLDFRA